MGKPTLARAQSPAVDGGHTQPAGGVGMRTPVRYVGVADWWGRRVWVEHGDFRSGLRYSSGAVIEFAWGRAGLGARELARSILTDAAGDRGADELQCIAYVHEVIARLPQAGFELDRADVLAWLEARP